MLHHTRQLIALTLLLAACGRDHPGDGEPSGTDPVHTTASAVAAELDDAEQATLDAARRALAEEHFEAVETILAELLARTPPHPEVLFFAGYADYERRLFERAARRLTAAVAQRPELRAESAGLGFALHHLGRYDEAHQAFEAALEADPDAYRVHYGLGLVALSRGDPEAARRHLDEALRRDPDLLEARLEQARLLEREDALDEALAAVTEVVERSPAHEEALYLQGRLLLQLGRSEQAEAVLARQAELAAVREQIAALDALAASGDDDPDLHAGMAALLLRIGDPNEARRAVRRGLHRFPDDLILQALAADLAESPQGD